MYVKNLLESRFLLQDSHALHLTMHLQILVISLMLIKESNVSLVIVLI
jgi:hypothetical protein